MHILAVLKIAALNLNLEIPTTSIGYIEALRISGKPKLFTQCPPSVYLSEWPLIKRYGNSAIKGNESGIISIVPPSLSAGVHSQK
jgi:hypothetical protein